MAPQELLRLVPDASPALQDILGASSDAVQPPIRAEIFGPQRFAQHGRSLGETHRAERAHSHAQTFFPRLRSNIDALRHAHRYIGVQAATGYDISPAAEWLLDNFHLIEAQLKEIHDGLPRRYFRALPVLVDEPLAGLPRIYSVAWAFVAHTDGAFDDDLLVQFLCAYQEARELNLSELWALPTTLRVVLIENLRRLAERVATNKAAREVANLCCDRIDTCPLEDLGRLLEVLTQRGVGPVFLAQMAMRLQDRWASEATDAQARVLAWLHAALPDLAALQTQQRADQAADNLSVSNAVTALRAIGDADWSDIVSRTSALMQRMLASPVFAAEQAITRDQTLHGVELLARRCGRSEAAVANTLLEQMHTATGADDPAAVASHWLFGAGRPALLAALGLHERVALVCRAAARRLALPVYLGALLVGTGGVIAWLMRRHGVEALSDWSRLGGVLGVVLMLFPVSEAVVAVINRLISESARPQHLPRLALAEGIPAEHRVLVVIPGMLTDAVATRALVHRLQLHYLANPERHTQFALLTDWADADTAQCAADAALLDDAVQQIRALNARHPPDAVADPAAPAPRFLVLHRARTFSPTEQRWIGWERKRGKLEQLVEVVNACAPSASASGPFLDLGAESRLAPGTRYLVTLDSDTRLPPGRLRELVGVAAHPHNQPRFDATGRAVLSGYGILQPRIVTPLPAPKDVTVYHWLFAGQCGIDPYSAASSEVYQDLFGEGTFTGKGLLNVQAMHAVLAGRLPEGRVLSHDLLEGSMVRCAAVTDIALVEDAPFHADVAASRVHRWTRGDWQLLPFLLQPRRYGLRAVNGWKLFDNLRRSLVAPMSLGLVLLSLSGAGVSPWVALGLVLAAFSAGPTMGAVAGFLPGREDIARGYFFRAAARDVGRALGGGLFHLAQLLQLALMAVDAIARALYRMLVSRRHLLQWTTAATAQAAASVHLRVVARGHASEPLVALALLGVLLAVGTPHPALSVVLCLLWAASPLTTWWVSRPRPARKDAELPRPEQVRLEAIARDTWRLFERVIGPEDRFLPPDNLQTLPNDLVAHRTSPTNIGLYLLSAACARAFGWIGTPELVTRLEATLATLATLERHRGHFLNWYDTQTGTPLLPRYVSTVDSGNLSGHLLAVAQACLALAEAPVAADEGDTTEAVLRLRALASACEQLAWDADFSFLYHRKRHLLHIGYRVAEQQLDAGFYDLLASESRLTSLLAIAKGDVPVRHWSALGRPFYAVGAHAGLRSWSGSMFEYLMPSLVLDEPHGSVLREACHAALREQIDFATERGVPWGISESAYAGRDHTLAYQYAPQGVPRLALRRTPPGELVIAPYATALAALIAPRRAAANFTALEALGARGPYGFLEALDFSAARQVDGETFTPVSTFMAHHQGMTLVALANVLLGGVAQRWGMANPHIEAVDSLLHERAPRAVSVLLAPLAGPPLQTLQRRAPGLLREVVPGVAAVEPTHVLSNGRYNVSLRANGAGWSRWGATGITRWRDDALRDAFGSFFYLRWDRQPTPVSITQHPAPDPAAHYHSTFHADRVCLDAHWPELQAHTTVWVSPEDDIEFRQIALHNLSDRTIDIELLSAFDITLSDARADEAHPAFTNLFVRAEWQASQQALVFARQPRLPTEHGLQAAHFLADADPQITEVRLQTDRQRWLGRNRAVGDPLAAFDAAPAGTGDERVRLGTGLDPVCALAVRLRLAPHSVSQLTFATAASDNGGTLHAVIDKYRQPSHVKRASLMSATLTGIRLRALRISPENFAAVQLLSTALLFSLTRTPTRMVALEDLGVCDRRLLWRFGLSGERPLVLVQVGVVQDLGLLRSLAQALRLWSWGEVACDLVVVNAEPASYLMPLQREIQTLRERHAADSAAERRLAGAATTALHALRAEELSADELSTLKTLARVRFHGDGRPLLHHVQTWSAWHEQALASRQEVSTAVVATSDVPGQVATTQGVFDAVSGDFRFPVSAARRPARPWINVLSNAAFGAQVSEAGGGYTWAVNSRMNQLTAWSNDPVADPPSEWFLLQDRKTLQVWSVSPSAWGAAGEDGGDYRIAHGQGLSVIRHQRGDLAVTAAWCVDAGTAVKQVRLHLVNHGPRTLHLRVIGVAEWLMGANRTDRSTVHTAQHRQRLPGQRLTALLATQRERAGGFGNGTAFLALAGPDIDDEGEDWTCDRREWFDARGCPVLPDHFSRQQGIGFDPCAALSSRLTLAGGEQGERVFLLGYAESPGAARRIATVAATKSAAQRVDEVRQHWDHLLGATAVQTPDPLFDAMVNRWLLYQTVSCRLWAKAGFYQAGGATGFRDQLQDAMALAWAAPQMLRDQIVLCASRQFVEGDVQHWWHAPQGAGVRTHFSDDLLWLPHACVRYLHATGDTTLLDEPVAFLAGAPIPDGAEDAYYTPTLSDETATVYEHAARTIDRSLRVGAHGLPLMGSGDWNDGMNRVGIGGRGESVWLGWFLCKLVADFAPLAHARGDGDRTRRWEHAAQGWTLALLGPAWDGQWFKRAFFDDGQALGSQANPEAKIDLIAQAWAVLSTVAPPTWQHLALAAVETHLVDHDAGLVRLLDPPLVHAEPSAGYIQAYPPGVRENGGQYAHAGVWALMAEAQAQHPRQPVTGAASAGDTVYRYFTYLSPAHRSSHPTRGAVYGLEPYVMAGDVYSQPPYVGRGGWSWYTGAAAWLHRAAIESMFGLHLGATDLCCTPCLPSDWPKAELTLRREGRTLRFLLVRARAADVVLQPGDRLLRPGERLEWVGLPMDNRFVVPWLVDAV
ncbi:GH36-type glycosyl hydrolase domain-containing protein [Sphaerotilus sp.]|uniref:GH36-type glycosyl hydrolase domain-containing protein n=1 Tax=Sphaerotilus sp. TaxID=2093942 RepID=UPI00286E5398|nr:glucoamylase family protein [Sphaerotilus sp.]